jgi:DNA-binding NtrC family response regulator
LIVATNRDLERLVGEGKFRKDLYYRINVVGIRTPPLREHPEDIPALAELFLDRLAAEGGPRKRISPEALELLVRHPYPGNVRELRNALERACALGRSAAIGPDDLPKEFRILQPGGFKPLAEVERDHILRALRLAGGRKSLAARFLEIDRSRLARKLRKYGISAGDAARGSEAES